ncbi:hypothetical protein [Desulfovibrio sp.]|uniref:hypothetical protein n=1 Tax=Desulfovibrio sp. TaxID=885 RepID=UPI003D118B3E
MPEYRPDMAALSRLLPLPDGNAGKTGACQNQGQPDTATRQEHTGYKPDAGAVHADILRIPAWAKSRLSITKKRALLAHYRNNKHRFIQPQVKNACQFSLA